MPLAPLTAEEIDLQGRRGAQLRRLTHEAVADYLALDRVKSPCIFLSGGVDSTIVLFEMISLGSRPGVITFQAEGVSDSGDVTRARKLADHYGLDFHLFYPTQDPDRVARGTEKIVREHKDMESRADIEVMFLMDEMFQFTRDLGYDSVFSGMAEPNLHITNRKYDIQGQGGLYTQSASNFMRIKLMEDDQAITLTRLAVESGLSIYLPLYLSGALIPYYDLEWRLLNLPVKKAITRSAYQDMIDESGAMIQPKPMQCGDSGSRGYFDTLLGRSEYARDFVGRSVSSAVVFYNSLKKHYRPDQFLNQPRRKRKKVSVWDTMLRNVEGAPVPKEWYEEFPTDGNGRALPPPEREPQDEEDLFGELEIDEVNVLNDGPDIPDEILLDDDGDPDTRLDCFGTPLWHPASWNQCPRAQAGLCGTYRPEEPIRHQDCEHFDLRFEHAMECMGDVRDQLDGEREQEAEVLQRWIDRARAVRQRLIDGDDVNIVVEES